MNLSLAETELPVRLRFDPVLTDDELLDFCAANEAACIERDPNGEIVVMSPAGNGSSRKNVRISRLLDEWAEADGRGTTTGPDGGYVLPDGSMRAPDAAWVSDRRMESVGMTNTEGFAKVCPEFIIELRSKSDRLAPREAKMEAWIANGAELAWLIDPSVAPLSYIVPAKRQNTCTTRPLCKGPAPWQDSNSSCRESGTNRVSMFEDLRFDDEHHVYRRSIAAPHPLRPSHIQPRDGRVLRGE